MKILIAGGGIGGLCAAIALQQAGFEVQVYEKVQQLSGVGAGITLWPNALRVLRALGVAGAVTGAGARVDRSHIRAANGAVLQDARLEAMQAQYGEPVIAIHRAALHEILIGALQPGTLHPGAGVCGFEQDEKQASLHFENGESSSGDLLIGADGVHSALRRQMFPRVQPRYAGYTAWRGVVTTGSEAALGLTSESWGVGARFGIVRVSADRVYWFATANQPAGEQATGEQRKARLLRLFSGWHEPVRRLLELTPADAILQNDIVDIAPFAPWSQGRATLLGDAAHPTTPNMGQGACMAIESAYVLARALKNEPDYQAALQRYENERRARTAWVTNTSWSIGRGGQINSRLACALRDLLVRRMPAGLLQKNIHRAAGYDVLKDFEA